MKRSYTTYVMAVVCLIIPFLGKAQLSLDGLKDKIKFAGDMRLRAEYDFNYLNSSGTDVDDRFRLRSRARYGFTFQYNEHYSFGMRIRAGNIKDQQSPHITWGSDGEDALWSIGFDKAYIKGDYGKWWWWGGKNDNPFYNVYDEMYWDNDVTPEGFAIGGNLKANDHWTFKPTAGYFFLESMVAPIFKNMSTLGAIQLLATGTLSKLDVNIAAGYFNFKDMPNYPDGVQTDTLNYGHFVGDLKLNLKTKLPIAFGGDVMINTTDYSGDSLIVSTGLQDQGTGFIVFVELGSLKEKGNWLAGVYYSHIEQYAVVNYLAQDDWNRWGFPNGATGTRSSNFMGEEFRLAYAFGPKFNVVGRFYLTKGIKPLTPTATVEEADRFRIDFNIGF